MKKTIVSTLGAFAFLAVVVFVLSAVTVHAQTSPLTPQEYTALRVKYKAAPHNFDRYFVRVGVDIYLKNLGFGSEEVTQEPQFGAGAFAENQDDIATSTTPFRHTSSVSVNDGFRLGDDPVINRNSVTEKFLFKDFADATTTLLAIQNKEGKNIYFNWLAFEFSGMPTTTAQLFVGTTTAGLVPTDDSTQRDITNPDNTLTALADNILITDLSVLDATSTVIWIGCEDADYKPAQKGYGQDLCNTPVKPGEYVTVYASSTPDDNGDIVNGGNLFAGKMFGKYRFLE